jgi:hypothetical protein
MIEISAVEGLPIGVGANQSDRGIPPESVASERAIGLPGDVAYGAIDLSARGEGQRRVDLAVDDTEAALIEPAAKSADFAVESADRGQLR